MEEGNKALASSFHMRVYTGIHALGCMCAHLQACTHILSLPSPSFHTSSWEDVLIGKLLSHKREDHSSEP